MEYWQDCLIYIRAVRKKKAKEKSKNEAKKKAAENAAAKEGKVA